MRRRDFITLSALVCPNILGICRSAAQQPETKTKVAVVIGVDKAGNLPVLNAAAAGARRMGAWLSSQGFEVKLFVDDKKAVKIDDIFEAINKLVEQGIWQRLVVYFSGHGYLQKYSEWWMLSGAPENPNQAISVNECIELARESAIPNITFISDACRSTPESLQAGRVVGGLIFPNRGPNYAVRPDIDRFYAALPGNPALELVVSNSSKNFEGIYTSSFLDAFAKPTERLVTTIDGVKVIPNVKLRDYLEVEVPARAEAKSIKLTQVPTAILESRDQAYLGRIMTEIGNSAPLPPKIPNILDLTQFALQGTALSGIMRGSQTIKLDTAKLDEVGAATGFNDAQANIREANTPWMVPGPESDRLRSAIPRNAFAVVVSGKTVVLAMPNRRLNAQMLASLGDMQITPGKSVIRVDFDESHVPGSILIRFEDGTSTVVAALPDFIAHVAVGRSGVVDIRYAPIDSFGYHYDFMDELYYTVAVSSKYGTFRIEGDRDQRIQKGRELGQNLRRGKAIDPSLGVYAAYAFAQADLLNDVRSVRNIMRSSMNADLFDVALLANVPIVNSANVVPFCPMFSQGWGLLRVKNATLAPAASQLQENLLSSLWTTFTPRGTDIAMTAMASGRLN